MIDLRASADTTSFPAARSSNQSYEGLFADLIREVQLLVVTLILPPQHALQVLRSGTIYSALSASTDKQSKSPPVNGFCWGHGFCRHHSPDCKQGLQSTATKDQPMGGGKYHWNKMTPAQRQLVIKNGLTAILA